MALALGFCCYFAEPVPASAAGARVLGEVLTSADWPWAMPMMRVIGTPGQEPYPTRKGKIPAAAMEASVRDALEAPVSRRINLAASRTESLNHCWIHLDTGRDDLSAATYPFEARAFCRAESLPAGKSIAAWLDLMHSLAVTLRAAHGVVVASGNEGAIHDELTLSTTYINDRPVHPAPAELELIRRHRDQIGAAFVRPPRWGTYLKPEHVEAIGGRARITEAIGDVPMQDLGPLLFVPLSATIKDALTPEVQARQRALADVLAPITVPA